MDDDKQSGEGLATDTFNPNDKSTLVLLPILNQTEIYIPKYFIQQVFSKKQKEGTRKFRLFVPTTSTRNLATRSAKKSIEIKRVNRDEIELLDKEGEDIISPPPKLSEFSKKDQAKLKEYFAELRDNEPLKEYELNKRPKTGKKKAKIPAPEPAPEPSPQYEEPIPDLSPEPIPAPREQKKRGRKQKYATVEEAKAVQAEQKRQASKKLYAELTKERLKQKAIKKGKYKPNEVGVQVKPQMAEPIETQTGEGIKSIVKSVVKGAKKVGRFIDTVINTDDYLPPSLKRVLADHGTETIISLTLRRNPVSDLITGAMNVVSGGVFNEKLKNQPYDKLFHLGLLVKTSNTAFVLEKIERVNISYQIASPKGLEQVDVSVPAGLTVEELINKTKERMGKNKFLDYDGYRNNCQDFIMNVLDANGLGNAENKKFVKQDTKELFEDSPILAKVSKKLTDVGASFNALFRGGAINENYEENKISTDNITMDLQYLLPHKENLHKLQLGIETDQLPQPLMAGMGIGRSFKKFGRQVSRVVNKVESGVDTVNKYVNEVDDAIEMVKGLPAAARDKYKKVGLDIAEILLKKGVPVTAGTIAGILGTMAGGPAAGIAASVGTSYLAGLASNEIAKREGIQGGSGLYAQGGRGMDSNEECCECCEMCGGKLLIDRKFSVRDIYDAAKSVPKVYKENVKSLKQGKDMEGQGISPEKLEERKRNQKEVNERFKKIMPNRPTQGMPEITNGVRMAGGKLGPRPAKGSPEMKEYMKRMRDMKKK